MGKATCRWIKKASKHSNEPKPTSFSKTLIKVESKITNWFQKLTKGETTMPKGRHLSETLRENTKSHLDVP
jgi:hypothetical protein